jgi:hypothetical protein
MKTAFVCDAYKEMHENKSLSVPKACTGHDGAKSISRVGSQWTAEDMTASVNQNHSSSHSFVTREGELRRVIFQNNSIMS